MGSRKKVTNFGDKYGCNVMIGDCKDDNVPMETTSIVITVSILNGYVNIESAIKLIVDPTMT